MHLPLKTIFIDNNSVYSLMKTAYFSKYIWKPQKQHHNRSVLEKNHLYQNRQISALSQKRKTSLTSECHQANKCKASRYLYKYRIDQQPKDNSFLDLHQRLFTREKKMLSNIQIHKNNKKYKYALAPLKKIEPVNAMRKSLSNLSFESYRSLTNSRRKLTDQYQNQMENMRMVQKLLLVKPSKESCRSIHKEFYKQHRNYLKNIESNSRRQIFKHKNGLKSRRKE